MNLDWNLDDKSKTNTRKRFLKDNWRNLNTDYILDINELLSIF